MPQSDHVWSEVDGIKVNVRVSDKHAVEETTIHNTYFTPFATDDPGMGIRIGKDGRSLISIAQLSSVAQLIAWKERHIALLDRLMDGYVRSDGDGEEIYVAKKYPNRSGKAVIRVFSLSWRTSSDKEGWDDFPELLSERYGLDRKTAWHLAWALVRAARLDMNDISGALIEGCEEYAAIQSNKAVPRAKREASLRMFEGALESYIEVLRKARLP